MAKAVVKTKEPFHFFNNIEGLNTQSTRYGKNSNQANETDNIVLTKRGFQNRGGQLYVNTLRPASNPELHFGIDFVRTVGGVTTRKKIAFGTDGNVYDYSTNPPTIILSGLTPGYEPDVLIIHGWLCFVDGINTPRKYNMTSWYQWGITAPASAPTLGLGGAGNPNGTYRFRVAYRRNPLDAIDPGAVSSMGTISAPVTAANQVINLTNIPISADPQVNARDIYVQISGRWYKATTINDNTTTTYTYDLLDSIVVEFEEGRTDRDPPPTAAKICEMHKDIAFLSDGTLLYWSILNEFEAFSVLDRVSNAFNPNDGIPITSLVSYTDLAVCKERSIYVRAGDDVSYTITLKVSDSGVVSNHSVVVKDNIFYYIAHDGFRVFDGNNSAIISRNINNLLFGSNIEKLIFAPYINKITGVYYSNNNVESVIWTIPTASNRFNLAFCYYPGFVTTDSQGQQVGAWVSWSNLDARFIFKTINASSLNDNIFTCGMTGFMNQVDVGYTDNGVRINCVYRQADQYFERPVGKKRLRDALFSVSNENLDYNRNPNCEWYIDGAPSDVNFDIHFFRNYLSRFDLSRFDIDRFTAEGDLVGWIGYSYNPFYTIAPRLTWFVQAEEDVILWQGWTLRIIDAGVRRTPPQIIS